MSQPDARVTLDNLGRLFVDYNEALADRIEDRANEIGIVAPEDAAWLEVFNGPHILGFQYWINWHTRVFKPEPKEQH